MSTRGRRAEEQQCVAIPENVSSTRAYGIGSRTPETRARTRAHLIRSINLHLIPCWGKPSTAPNVYMSDEDVSNNVRSALEKHHAAGNDDKWAEGDRCFSVRRARVVYVACLSPPLAR